MKSRILLVFALLAALIVAAAPRQVAAPTPTCKGKKATVVVDSSQEVTVNDDNAVIVGTGAADTITVNGYNPLVCSLGGDDVVTLYNGGRAYLGTGDDNGHGYYFAQLFGESGNDILNADYYCSYANGGSGDDQVYAYICSTADGGSGNDYVAGEYADSLYGGAGQDSVSSYYTSNVVDCGTNRDQYSTDGYETTLKRCEDQGCACLAAPAGVFFTTRAVDVRRIV